MPTPRPKRSRATFVATVGSKPQLVTLALDLLLARGEPVQQAIVIHTSLDRLAMRESVAQIGQEFALNYPDIRLRPVCLCGDDGLPLKDVTSEAAIREAFRVLYREIRAAKQSGHRVHLSIAGGRKTLAIYGVAAAQLLFDESDAAWHLDSDPEIVTARVLHAPVGRTRLVPVPVLRWSQINPLLTGLATIDDPFDAVETQEQRLRNDAWRRADQFVNQVLTAAEREVVELVVREGLTNAQTGARLCRSPRTAGHQLSSAYAKLREFYELAKADRHTLMAVLSRYFR